MAALRDLPLELLTIVLQALPPSALISTSRVSKRFYDACLPLLYSSFKASGNPKKTWRRFQSFRNMIIRRHSLGPRVKSVFVTVMYGDDIEALHEPIVPFLSQASNIQQLAVPGHPNLLAALKRPFFSGDLLLQRLRAFQCVNCGPEIWEIIPQFPRLSRLSLRGLSYVPSTLHLQASSLPVKHILLEGGNLSSQAICVIIRSCKHLLSFQYVRPLEGESEEDIIDVMPPNASDIHDALLLHKDHLEEFIVQDVDYHYLLPYDEFPKFGSFEVFPALQILCVDCKTLSAEESLPPSLRSIAIRHCSSSPSESMDVLLSIGRHPSVEEIQFSMYDCATDYYLRELQSSGEIRKEIQVGLVPDYATYIRQCNHLLLASDPLHWISTPELS